MQTFITGLVVEHESLEAELKRPFKVKVELQGTLTRTEMRMLQTAMIQNLPLSSIGCAKLKGKLK